MSPDFVWNMKKNIHCFLVLLLFVLPVFPVMASELVYTTISIPMRDTNFLAADLWYTPPEPTAKPVILIQTPYNKNFYRLGVLPGHAGGTSFPVSTNYNYVVVDWRGFYGSSDASVPGYKRGLDGYDCVEWIAAQSWSNGRIGTWGSSALGQIQYQTAFEDPPHLVCCTIQVRHFQTGYDDYYYGGVYRKEMAESIASLGLIGTGWILKLPGYDDWQGIEENSDTPEKMKVPALLVSGWFDHSPDATLRSFAEFQAQSDPSVRDKHRLIFGPWTHGGLQNTQQGALSFPSTIDLNDTEIRFWDYMLRDQTNNSWADQPVVQFYQMGENIWINDTNWTGAASWAGVPRSSGTFYLRAGGRLTADPPEAAEPADSYLYDPEDPTPTFGGARFTPPPNPSAPEGPQDLSTNIETRADVLVYSTDVLTNDLRMNATNLVLTLYASSDRTDTDFAVRLTDVYPDGSSYILVQGIRRARFRNSLSTEELMVPGTVYPIPVQLQNLAYTFRKGHRLRLVVSSADYPMYDRNLNDGGPMYTTNGTPLVASNSIYYSSAYLSRLDFQTVPDDLDGDDLPDVWEGDNFLGLQRNGEDDYDSDGQSDLEEAVSGTSPTNTASRFLLESAGITSAGFVLNWEPVAGRLYDVLWAPALTNSFQPLDSDIEPPQNSYTDTVHHAESGAFYKISVRLKP
jgi:predicted acyl esterase